MSLATIYRPARCELVHTPDELELIMATEATESSIQPAIQVTGVSKRYMQNGTPLAVLEDVDFVASDGEFVSIIGPSGCGKSTLLNIIAGLDQPSSGAISIYGQTDNDRLGGVGYMQQRDLLMPWRSVLDNAIIGLEVQGVAKAEAQVRARALLDDFGLSGFEDEYPHTLSGGMRQRAASLTDTGVASGHVETCAEDHHSRNP